MRIPLLIIIVGAVLAVSSCKTRRSDNSLIASDFASIKKGQALFSAHCAMCHRFNTQGIGPKLAGITDSVTLPWLRAFIKNPAGMIDSGDARANHLVSRFRSVMPSFDHLTEGELDQLISFMHAQKTAPASENPRGMIAIDDPIPDTIQSSGLVIQAIPFARVPSSAANNKAPLARITKMDYRRGDHRLFVVDMRGKMYFINSGKPSVYLDLAALVPAFVHEPGLGAGFGSFAFHPDFATNGLLYTVHTEKPGIKKADFFYEDSIPVTYQYVLSEWHTATPSSPSFKGAPRELLRIDMVTVQHGIQEIAFNPYAKRGSAEYGKLYVCVGDGGALDDRYHHLVGSPSKVWGSLLRIDPSQRNSRNGRYGLPADNPFYNSAEGLPEMYAYGFRNPHRVSWGSNGALWLTNIGEAHIESVYAVQAGKHHGWPIREGAFRIYPEKDVTKLYPLNHDDSLVSIIYPVAQYDHEWGYAGASGGFEYGGNAIPSLRGKYVFGDIPSGKLLYFDVAEARQKKTATIYEWLISLQGKKMSLKELYRNKRVDLHFGSDHKGELYLLIKADGMIYKLGNHDAAEKQY